MTVIFYNANGQTTGFWDSPLYYDGDKGGRDANLWFRIINPSILAPNSTTHAVIQLRKYDTNAGQTDSWAWFWRPYVGHARQGQTEANPFAHGSGRAELESSNARIASEETARANADSALAQRATNVEARAGGLEARAGIVETAVADHTSKLAAARLELSAVTSGGRAQVVIRSDNNSGAGVDIIGDVSFLGAGSGGGKTVITPQGGTVYYPNGNIAYRWGIWQV